MLLFQRILTLACLIRLSTSVPTPPRAIEYSFPSVITNNKTSSIVTITWRPPLPRPGPTSYTLKVTGDFYNSTGAMLGQYTAMTSFLQGYNNTSVNFTKAQPAGTYHVTLIAMTSAGDSQLVQGPVCHPPPAGRSIQKRACMSPDCLPVFYLTFMLCLSAISVLPVCLLLAYLSSILFAY